MITKGVRDLDPDFRPAGAGMHDEAQALIPEGLWSSWLGPLGGRRPRSDPGVLRTGGQLETQQKDANNGTIPQRFHEDEILHFTTSSPKNPSDACTLRRPCTRRLLFRLGVP